MLNKSSYEILLGAKKTSDLLWMKSTCLRVGNYTARHHLLIQQHRLHVLRQSRGEGDHTEDKLATSLHQKYISEQEQDEKDSRD